MTFISKCVFQINLNPLKWSAGLHRAMLLDRSLRYAHSGSAGQTPTTEALNPMCSTIEVHDLTQRYGELCALDAISFALQGPGITGLLGRNGAGKSTLLRVLAGLLLPDRGTVRVAGFDAVHDARALRACVGYAPEHPALDEHSSPLAHLRWLASARGLPAAHAQRALERCDLTDLATRPIHALSHGQRQRVGLASALLHEPPVLLLDEPTTGLDPAQLAALRSTLTDLATHHTILLSTHMLHELRALAPRALLLERGALRATLPIPADLATDPLEAAFMQAIQGEA